MVLEITDNAIVRRGDGWLSAWVGTDYVMMSADTGTCISLSETGGRIWELVEEPRPVSELCSVLTDEYQADAAVIHQDVMSFLEHMQSESAIVIS